MENLFNQGSRSENSIGLVVDGGVDFPEEIIGRHQVEVVPLRMDWPDIENLPGENIFQKMREAEKRGIRSFGRTSQPSPRDFLVAFKKQLERFSKIVCVTITSKLSGTYNSAIQARNFLPSGRERVFVIDSLNGSGGEGLLALKIIDLIGKKKRIKEIVDEIENFKANEIYLRVMLEDVKWLEASGRISKVVAGLLRKIQKLGIRPMIGVKKGIIVPVGVKTGVKNLSSALLREFKVQTEKMRKQNKRIRVAITHGDNPKEAKKLKKMIENSFEGIEIAFVNLMDDVLGVVAGPGVIALAWAPAN